MKTIENKQETTQIRTSKKMCTIFLTLAVFLLISSDITGANKKCESKSKSEKTEKMVSLTASFCAPVTHSLEVDKLLQRTCSGTATFSTKEEHFVVESEQKLNMEEWMINATLWNAVSSVQNDFDTYLTKLVVATRASVDKEIEATANLAKALQAESDEALELESWMTLNMPPFTTEPPFLENDFLAELVAETNAAVYTYLQLECKCREFLKQCEKDQPLVLEDWMINKKYWCCEKEKKEYQLNASYAMKTK